MKARIKNFQSIKDISFEIEGVTVITGESDVGKSSIIRALEACIFNKSGDYFIRDGEEATGVRLSCEEEIVWMKGRGVGSQYDVGENKFTAVGRGQLKEIRDLGFVEIDVDSFKIRPQIAKQLTQQFLISSAYSPAVVSKLMGDLSGVKKLVTGKKKCVSDFKAARAAEKVYNEQKIKYTDKLKLFKDVHIFRKKCNDLEDKRLEFYNKKEKLCLLKDMVEERKDLLSKYEIIVQSNLVPPKVEDDTFIKKYQLVSSVVSEFVKLTKAVNEISGCDLKVPSTVEAASKVRVLPDVALYLKYTDILERILNIWKSGNLEIDFGKLPDIESRLGVYTFCSSKVEDLVTTRKLFDLLGSNKSSKESEKKEEEKLLSEFESCPLCERPL